MQKSNIKVVQIRRNCGLPTTYNRVVPGAVARQEERARGGGHKRKVYVVILATAAC